MPKILLGLMRLLEDNDGVDIPAKLWGFIFSKQLMINTIQKKTEPAAWYRSLGSL